MNDAHAASYNGILEPDRSMHTANIVVDLCVSM